MTTTPPPRLLGQSWRTRAALAALRLLAWSNGLEAGMALIALAFAAGALLYPPALGLVGRFELAPKLAVVMIATASVSLLSMHVGWRIGRMATSLVAFIGWGLLAVAALGELADVAQRTGLLFAAFAALELGVFVRLKLHMDTLRDTIEAAVMLNNASVALTGRPLRPQGEDDGHVGRHQDGT